MWTHCPRGVNNLITDEITAVWSEPHFTPTLSHSIVFQPLGKAGNFHSESSSLRNYHFPFNVIFIFRGTGEVGLYYWSLLKLAVTLKISHWLLNQVNLWQGPLRSRSIAWWCHCPMVHGVDDFASDGWYWTHPGEFAQCQCICSPWKPALNNSPRTSKWDKIASVPWRFLYFHGCL